MKNRILTLAILITFSGLIYAQDEPNHFSNHQSTVEPRGDCIEVLNTSQFFAGEFGGGTGTASVCFNFPSTCGAEIHMNSNSVVDFMQFVANGDTSGVIGVGSSGFGNLEHLTVGQVELIPFSFSPPRAFEGPIQVDLSFDGFIVEKLGSGLPGDMFVNIDLLNFSATLLSNRNHFTNYSIECKPLNICTDYVGVQYAVACPGKELNLSSKCFDPDYKTIWVNPFGDTVICESDTLHLGIPVPVGLYQWITPCNKGYVLVYHPDSIRIEAKQVFCSSKKKLYLPTGLKGDWSTGAKNSNYIYVNQPGAYGVNVAGCVIDTITVDIVFENLNLELRILPDVDTVLFSRELKVVSEAIPGTTFLWEKNDQPVFGYYGPGLYTVTGVYDECREQDTILVIPHLFAECDWPVYGPNVFSPNGDSENDSFEVFGPLGSTSEIWVYDRWGELMFHGDKWDGTYKGLPCSPDVYVFRAKVVWNFEQCNTVKGDVTIIR